MGNNKRSIEEDIEDSKKRYRSYKLDMSFGELMNLYKEDELIIPDYQRNFQWTKKQRTRFIESLLVGIPVPTIFVAENDDGKWEIIDGLQRLSTFFSFFGKLNDDKNDNWKLGKAELIESIKGLTYSELPPKSQYNIKRRVCSVEVIQAEESDYTTRYELFNRLNTGGTPLSRQEIRNVLYRKLGTSFTEFLVKWGNNSDFIDLINPTEKQKNTGELEELILRFCCLYENPEEKMRNNLSDYMDKFMKSIVEKIGNKQEDENLLMYEEILKRVINILKPEGSEIFRSKSNNKFSTSYYDGIMIGVSKNIDFYEKAQNTLNEKIEKLHNNEEFKEYSGSSSLNRDKTIGRLKVANDIFKNTD
ncbi:MAG: DUF262 domain-containing protein [Methanobrevibacter sp. CfCl-M3]